MRVLVNACLWLFVIASTTTSLYAQDDPAAACREAARLFEDDDIPGAIEEARWCVEALEQLKQAGTAKLFPEKVAGFTGGDVNSQSTMGVNITERTYSRKSKYIDVSHTGGGAGSGFAAIARMGMSMGGAGKKMRIQRYVVLDTSEGNNSEFMVTMKSGGMLSVTSNTASHEEVIEFLKEFPIAELDQALQ